MKALLLSVLLLASAASGGELKVRISWGHRSAAKSSFYIKPVATTAGAEVRGLSARDFEPGDAFQQSAAVSTAGGGDTDALDLTLAFPGRPARRLQNLHVIWADLIAQSDADTARRLGRDAAFTPDSPRLTIFTDHTETKGFSVTVDQLQRERAMWIPSLDVYVTAGDQPIAFEDHQKDLARWRGRRILDRVAEEPEAAYEQYKSLWEDMGSPAYIHSRSTGQIVCLTWDSAIPKFGVDRGAGVQNDLGNPDKFRFWFDIGDLTKGIEKTWRGQRLEDGLPVITTTFEKDGIRYEIEQFAYPLNGIPKERRGDIPMVLLQKLRVTNLQRETRAVAVTMMHRRALREDADTALISDRVPDAILFRDHGYRRVLFTIEGAGSDVEWSGTRDYQREQKRTDATVSLELPAGASREFVVKLPSPVVEPGDVEKLLAIDYNSARSETLRFWSDYVGRGAQFTVPEKAVNDLFRATLWHALRLPRRHGGENPDTKIDLPYSNFAYSQTGTPWPVNQSVYVDYMLYGLRGYDAIATEELLAQYRNNQEYNGHINGYANWMVYTPGMLYAVAQNYLLSGDRAAFDRLLPASIKALDWCLDQVKQSEHRDWLVRGPLNDGTGEGLWAFNHAYMFAGLQLFGRVLTQMGDARGKAALQASEKLCSAIERGFGRASARSPLVQLRDHTWSPYVPAEASTYGRILDQWYPTDVDTGAVHLLRLNALDPKGPLADALLNDHEDNLFLHGWGMANEPVYNQQATAHLLRDDAKAAIRAFYSYMACAFSHSVFEPVEHRWTHGQYFGPPSTDGAWFELYRNMLLREMDDNSLLIGQATPRKWLEDGKTIEVKRAPTYFGPVSFTIDSRANSGKITARVDLYRRAAMKSLLIRLRHPQARPLRTVTVNGQHWAAFDLQKEWIRIDSPQAAAYTVVATY